VAAQRHLSPKDTRMTAPNPPDMANLKAAAAFTCTHEAKFIPPRDPEAEQLYQHARWLRNANLLKEDPAAYPAMERLIRIATAYGHDKANLALRGMLKKGQAKSPNPIKESVDLVEDLIRRGIPGGYYDMGNYLMEGYGVVGDMDLAIRYYRKAADMGSPDAQYLIGAKLVDLNRHTEAEAAIGLQMHRCAAEQGHAVAALELGVYIYEERLQEGIEAFQLGAKAGNAQSASRLERGFEITDPAVGLYLGQSKADPERARRYKVIGKMLSDYDYRDPKVPEIDSIVPLPPAKLPPWDGKLQWLEAHKANVPPPLPTEERIAQMAHAKGLDPKTGRAVSQ
jgi:TPR repeat protein